MAAPDPALLSLNTATTRKRWGLAQAVHHARHRSAFGKLLSEQPLMRNVLADLAIESEAATAVTMRVARAYDEDDAAFRRIATAVMKHWVCPLIWRQKDYGNNTSLKAEFFHLVRVLLFIPPT